MKTVIVVSPDYLTAVYRQSTKFSFILQGYGKFANAIQGVLKVNCGELLGCAFIGEKLPQKGTSEFGAMIAFLEALNQLNDSKKIVFVLQTVASSALSELATKMKNLRIFAAANVPLITDEVIDQQIFGSLVPDAAPAYRLEETEENRQVYSNDFLLHYVPIANKSVFDCCSDVDRQETLQLTLENDKVYQSLLAKGNNLLSSIRKERIQKLFGIKDKRLSLAIDGMVKDLAPDLWCLCNVIREGL